jgi:phosphoenolpyruvate synthase/pyruvate phosphate dikinase
MNVRDRAHDPGASRTCAVVAARYQQPPPREKVAAAMTFTTPSQLHATSILWFEDSAAADPRRVGGKAAALATLADRLPVPPGFVVVGALDTALVELAYAELADRAGSAAGEEPLVAVRSSATDEDGLQASFAGQHETILGVRGIDELLGAIAVCRESAHSDRALSYRRANGLAADCGPLPVLVQLLVAADAAAVVFSVDPVAPARGDVLVNAAFGLGESIVGGTVTPDAFTLSRRSLMVTDRTIADKRRMTVRVPGGSREIDVPVPLRRRPSISDAQAREAAALALRLERELGLPVDLELAWSGDDVHLLQCRPITTLAQEAA